MPVRDRRPGDERPLFRAVNERRLMGPVGGQREGQTGHHGSGEAQAASRAEPHQAERGPIARAVDRAQENNWVYPSMAEKVREKGLLDKADEIFSKVKAQLGGK